MNFDRKAIKSVDDRLYLDCRMVAFKHNLMDCRFLYWDIVNSKKIESIQRRNIQKLLIEYLYNVYRRHPEDISDFLITEVIKDIKSPYYKGKYWCINGDGIILGITTDANTQKIIDELSNEVLLGESARTAIGYYTGNNDFILPDDDMRVLELSYFKNQMILGQINDTKPSEEQIEEYYRENFKYVKQMELIHRKEILK